MKPQEAYDVIFNELYESFCRLEECKGYCENDLETARHLSHEDDIKRYELELMHVTERIEKVSKVMRFIAMKLKPQQP